MNKNEKKEPKYFEWYFKITFTYGQSLYTVGWGRNKKQAINQIFRDFVMVDKVREVTKSTWLKHKND